MLLALTLALAAGQLLEPVDPEGPIITNPAAMNRLAFFEFAPTSGAGMQDVAAHPLPNWAMQSEALGTAPWATTENTTPLVVTNAFTTDPTYGSVTRLQLAATTGSSYTLRYQPFTSGSSFPLFPATITYSLMVKGNAGTSGTVDIMIYRGTGYTRVDCPFTSSWAPCSVSATTDGASHAVYIGNATGVLSTAARSAADILVAQVMVNVGSSRSPYIATTTAAKGYTLTGAKSEALTFSRTGVAYATMGTGGGLRTTNIANGDLILMPGAQPRAEYDSAGTLGLLVESSRSNLLLRSEEMTNAVWQKFGSITVPTPDTVVAPDGATTADVVVVPASPTSSTTLYQSHTATAATTYTCTGYVKASSGSGTVYWNLGNNVDFTTGWVSSACSVTSSSWTRCSVSRTATSAVQALYVGSDPGGARVIGANFNFAMWGAQCEAGAYATSYIPTTAGAAVRNVDAALFDLGTAGPSPANMSAAASATRLWTTSSVTNPAVFAFNNVSAADASGKGMWLYSPGTSGTMRCLSTNDVGTAYTTGLVTPSGTRAYCYATTGGTLEGAFGTAMTSSASRSGNFAGVRWLNIGGYAAAPSATALDGIVSRVCLDSDQTRCR